MPAWDDWIRVCYHEAGHAVASVALCNLVSPMVLRCVSTPGGLMAQGTYQAPAAMPARDGETGELIPLPYPLKSYIMRLAAGGVAEELRFGQHGDGVRGDHGIIGRILLVFPRDAESATERASNYQDTRSLLHAHWGAVVRMAEIALRRFRSLDLADAEFPNTQIFSSNAVSRIFTNPPLTDQEHSTAQLKAWLYARDRGNGADPEYQPGLAVEDFEKAAGDVFGELP